MYSLMYSGVVTQRSGATPKFQAMRCHSSSSSEDSSVDLKSITGDVPTRNTASAPSPPREVESRGPKRVASAADVEIASESMNPSAGVLESVRRLYVGLQSFRSMSRMDASLMKASALRLRSPSPWPVGGSG